MQQIADYDIIQPLGEGAQGQYWLARTPARLEIDHQMVALKTVTHAARDEDFARLGDYLRLYASIDSPHLVRLFDVGQQGDLLYMAGEYLEGGSLAQPARPLSRIDVLRHIAEATLGAHALHEVGIAHRSIRPGNVLMANPAAGQQVGAAKLGDLGLSQILSPGQTITGAAKVSAIEYLPPELIQGQEASRASDIWAIGATLHKALTGQPLYPHLPTDSLVTALRYILNERPTLSDALRNGERRAIEAAVAADPADRPITAEIMAKEIQDEVDRQTKMARQ
ncbi:MAG: serine/threonine-protein kinase [Actinomycetota bacterium]